MAEESTNLPVTRNMMKLYGDNSRRNSTGKIIPPKSGKKILPHIPRASTGSCHDFCKFGNEHAFVVKARDPKPRRITTKTIDKQSSVEVEVEVSPMKRKAKTFKIKQSPGFNTHSVNMPNNNQQSSVSPLRKKASMVEIKRSPGYNTFSPNIPNNNEQQVMKKSIHSPNSVSSNVLAERKKISANNLKTSLFPKSHSRSNESMKQEVSVSNEKKVSSIAEDKSPSAKSSISLELKSLAKKPLSFSKSSGNLRRSNTVKIIGNRRGTSKAAITNVSGLPKVLLSPSPSLKNIANLNARKHLSLKKVDSLTNHNEIKKAESEQSKGDEVEQKGDEVEQPHHKSDEVQEKTLYVIKMETENRSFESDTNKIYADDESLLPPSLSSSPPQSELSSVPSPPYCSSTSEEDEGESEYTVSESEDVSFSRNSEMKGAENRVRKSGVVHTEEKDSKNLKFKLRGKAVNIESENNVPRKLKFRRGRVLGENQNVKEYVRIRSFKRREVVDDKSCETGSERVVLRHQDVQGQMDAQGLFNNMIEETASKFVENRKSMVKALVGAFETVISLQHKKPTEK